jgi:hypothetical protein
VTEDDDRPKPPRELSQKLKPDPALKDALALPSEPMEAHHRLRHPPRYVPGQKLSQPRKAVFDYILESRSDPKLRENVEKAEVWLTEELRTRLWDPAYRSTLSRPKPPPAPKQRMTKQKRVLAAIAPQRFSPDGKPSDDIPDDALIYQIDEQIWDETCERLIGRRLTLPHRKTILRFFGRIPPGAASKE